MKNKHFLKAAAFVLAAAFVCTSSSVTAWNIKKDISDNNNSNNKETVQPIAAEIVPEEERWSVKEQLTYASKGNDDTKLTLICNNLIDELNETKKSIDAESAEIAQWADGEILERQKQYEKTINEKYTQTIQALNNVAALTLLPAPLRIHQLSRPLTRQPSEFRLQARLHTIPLRKILT